MGVPDADGCAYCRYLVVADGEAYCTLPRQFWCGKRDGRREVTYSVILAVLAGVVAACAALGRWDA